MPSVHFLNVSPGDCTIIRHASGRVSMIDICDGNIDQMQRKVALAIEKAMKPKGNFGMKDYPSNPIRYAESLGISSIFRFILSHPDMDHMDGLNALLDDIGITNFWDAGIARAAPEFGEGCGYNEDDWYRYETLRDGSEPGVTTLHHLAGSRFTYANKGNDPKSGGDGLYILSPDAKLAAAASEGDDFNDGSYVILYRSIGGRIIIPGDAHDGTWEYVLEHHAEDVENCSVLIAPHHGRDSDRSFDFLDHIKPKLTLFGCAPSEHLAYGAWNSRGMPFITSNQAGNIVLEIGKDLIDVYIENERFAEACAVDCSIRNDQSYVFLDRIYEHSSVPA